MAVAETVAELGRPRKPTATDRLVLLPLGGAGRAPTPSSDGIATAFTAILFATSVTICVSGKKKLSLFDWLIDTGVPPSLQTQGTVKRFHGHQQCGASRRWLTVDSCV